MQCRSRPGRPPADMGLNAKPPKTIEYPRPLLVPPKARGAAAKAIEASQQGGWRIVDEAVWAMQVPSR